MKINHLNKIALAIAITIPLAACGNNSSNDPSNKNTVSITASLQPATISVGETSLLSVTATANNEKDLTQAECDSTKPTFSDISIASKSDISKTSEQYENNDGKATCKTTLTLKGNKAGHTDVTLSYGDNKSKPQLLTVTSHPGHHNNNTPTGDGNKKYVVYMMSQDISGLTPPAATKNNQYSDIETNKLSLFPAGYKVDESPATLVSQCKSNSIDDANSAFCKLYNTKKSIDKKHSGADLELMLAFEKPHTGRGTDGKIDKNLKTDLANNFNQYSGFTFPKGVGLKQIRNFISALHQQHIYVFDSIGGWDYSNPVMIDKNNIAKDFSANERLHSATNWIGSKTNAYAPQKTGSECKSKLLDYFHAGLANDSLIHNDPITTATPDSQIPFINRKYTEDNWSGYTDGLLSTIIVDYSAADKTCADQIKQFDYFPNPYEVPSDTMTASGQHDGGQGSTGLAKLIPSPEALDAANETQTTDIAKQYIKNWVVVADAIGADGIDVDYEESWYADLTATRTLKKTNANWHAFQSIALANKYNSILGEIDNDISTYNIGHKDTPLSLSTAAGIVAADPIDGATNWWLSNLKGLAVQAAKISDTESPAGNKTKQAYRDMDHIGIMSYDLDTSTVSGYSPTDAGVNQNQGQGEFGLLGQTNAYLQHWNRFMNEIGATNVPILPGIELAQPAYPQPFADAVDKQYSNCMIVLKNAPKSSTDCNSTTGPYTGTNTPATASGLMGNDLNGNGVIIWELNSSFKLGEMNKYKNEGTTVSNLLNGSNVATFGDLFE